MPDSPLIRDTLILEGAAACGTLSYASLAPFMSSRARTQAETLCPGAAGVIVAAFPYFAGHRAGNLALYARGLDYHIAIPSRLASAAETLRAAYPGRRFVPGADNSPLPEKQAARLAGIGLVGRHTLIICPPYGSYVFLGTLLTDLPLSGPPSPSPSCAGCGRCASACPSGALSYENGRPVLSPGRCLSRLSQKKGRLAPQEERLLAAHPYAWGCDLCQNACPWNQEARLSPLPELTGQVPAAPYLSDLTDALLSSLDEAAFQSRYGNRAFAWRGVSVLKRNLSLHKK